MEKTAINAFYLPGEDYRVLAALWGLDELQSLFRVRQEPLPEQEVYYALHRLMQRGMVDENRKLCEPYKEVFDRIFAADRITDRSFGTTFRMLASEEPVISQEWMTSHRAIWFRSRNAFFSPTVPGGASPKTAAATFQNRFCGWP